MDPRSLITNIDARTIIAERDLSHVKVAIVDIDGIMRGKYMSRDKFLGALERGFGFSDVVFGWDCQDQLYDNGHFTGWHTGYPDAVARIVPESCRALPFEDPGLLFLCEFSSRGAHLCPRTLLRRVIERARALGFEAAVGFEYEVFFFRETPASVRAKHYRDLTPMSPGWFGYSTLRNSVESDFYRELIRMCAAMDIGIEGLHEEAGPGVIEAALAHDHALAAADRAAIFKTFVKVLAQRKGMMATFMAKWSQEWPGQSGHIHLSLTSNGKTVFHDPAQQHGISRTLRHFIGGQQRLMPELLAMVAPTVNSYSRLVPGHWAPVNPTWGVENRTCALRVISGSAAAQRVEYRVAAADANPYLALAAALASGLHGIETGMEPGPLVEGNAYDRELDERATLPRTLFDAAQLFKQSAVARDWFGPQFVEHFAATREWEEREFRRHVTDWELARYFEII